MDVAGSNPVGGSKHEFARGRSSLVSRVLQLLLGGFLAFAGIAHLTNLRSEFQAQVPTWVPFSADFVVVASGVVEICLGALLLTVWKQPGRSRVGWLVAAFFVAVFPGNIAQYVEGRDAFGLDTDRERLTRLFFQPLLIAWAILATRRPSGG